MIAAKLILGWICLNIVYVSYDPIEYQAMPPVPEISHDSLFNILKDEEIFDKNGQALPQDDPIWKGLCKKYDFKMLPKSLHLHVYKNCVQNCRSRLLEYKSINVRKVKKTKKHTDLEYQIYNKQNPHNKKSLKFSIQFSAEEWLKIKPVMSKRKKKLQIGWTDIFYKKIWTAEGLKCAYNFKNLSVTGSVDDDGDDINIIFNAFCTECQTGMNGMLIKSQEEGNDTIGFQIDTFAVQDVEHTFKRDFAREERKEGKKSLANMYATDYRGSIQKERMQGRRREPAHLHDSLIYQDARQEAKDEAIGYQKSFTLFSPHVIKTCGIRKISLNPFYVFYWTDDQLEFWTKACKLKLLPISLDATGGLVRKTIAVGMKCNKTLFCYTLVIGLDGKIVPLMQFITSIHHVAIIEEALNTWIEKSGAQVPRNVSTDGSPALQHAVCKSFNKITFTENNLRSYEYLNNDRNDLPPCYYKSDLAHLLRTLNYWPCFKEKKGKNNLLFYKRCVAFISQVTSLQDFKKAAVALFAISSCDKYVEGSQIHEYLIFFSDAIKTYVFPEENQETTNAVGKTRTYTDEPIKTQNSLTIFIDQIIDEAKQATDAALIPLLKKTKCDKTNANKTVTTEPAAILPKKPNGYACKGFQKNFKALCLKFPSWTNVFAAAYGYEGDELNSARSETHFKNRKAQIPRPMSIVRFLLRETQIIEAEATRDYKLLRKVPESTKSESLPTKSPFELNDTNQDT